MRAPAHNKYTSKTYTERRAERARVEVEDRNILVLLVDTQLSSNMQVSGFVLPVHIISKASVGTFMDYCTVPTIGEHLN